jgi:hypothetical protein
MKNSYPLFSFYWSYLEINLTSKLYAIQFFLNTIILIILTTLLFPLAAFAQKETQDSMSNFAIMVNIAKPDTAYLGKLVRAVYKLHNTKPAQAEKIALEGFALAENAKLAHSSYVFSRMLGIIASRQNQFDKGNHYLYLALQYSNLTNNPYQTKEIAHLLAKNYKTLKKLDSVLHFKDIEGLAKERVFSLEKARVIHKLEDEIYTEEREIQLLLEENHHQLEIIERQSREEYILGAFFIVIAILAYVLFRNRRHKQQIKELKINKKFEEIAHITSHQLRAPVASILGLVSIFNKEKPEDPVNQEIVEHLNKSAQELDKMLKDVVQKTYADDDKKI